MDTVDKTYHPINDLDRKNWEACKYRSRHFFCCWRTRLLTVVACSIDDPDIYDGAPVGLQIMGRKFEEEKVLAIAKVVYTALLKEQKSVKAAL